MNFKDVWGAELCQTPIVSVAELLLGMHYVIWQIRDTGITVFLHVDTGLLAGVKTTTCNLKRTVRYGGKSVSTCRLLTHEDAFLQVKVTRTPGKGIGFIPGAGTEFEVLGVVAPNDVERRTHITDDLMGRKLLPGPRSEMAVRVTKGGLEKTVRNVVGRKLLLASELFALHECEGGNGCLGGVVSRWSDVPFGCFFIFGYNRKCPCLYVYDDCKRVRLMEASGLAHLWDADVGRRLTFMEALVRDDWVVPVFCDSGTVVIDDRGVSPLEFDDEFYYIPTTVIDGDAVSKNVDSIGLCVVFESLPVLSKVGNGTPVEVL